jgi:hypothetical protein
MSETSIQCIQAEVDAMKQKIVEFGDLSSVEKEALVSRLRTLVKQWVEQEQMFQRVGIRSQLDLILNETEI